MVEQDPIARFVEELFKTPEPELKHYGVKGMRWGVRKDDSGSAGPSRSEKKQEKRDASAANLRARAAKADVRSKELQSEIDAAPTGGLRNNLARRDLASQKQYQDTYRDDLLDAASRVESGRLTKNQKTALVGGLLVAGVVGYGVYGAAQQSGQLNSAVLRGQAALRGEKFDFARNEKFKNAKTADDVLATVVPGINPNYSDPGGQMNCRRCSLTYELRRRGYDVSATASALGWGQSETGLINALTPGGRNVNRATSLSTQVASNLTGSGIRTKANGDTRTATGERYSHADAKDRSGLAKLLGQQPDGARGEAVFNFGAFGHSLSYERFGDKTYIFDTQKGQRFDVGDEKSYKSFLTKWGIDNVRDVQLTRLDNVDLDQSFLSRWATNSKAGANEEAAMLAQVRARTAARQRALDAKAREEALAMLAGGRPAGMQNVTWDTIRREAGVI